jgi:hypothetical protein
MLLHRSPEVIASSLKINSIFIENLEYESY